MSELFKSIVEGDLDKVVTITDLGVDLNVPNENNIYPLHLACVCNKLEIAILLVGMGAKINQTDKDGRTCLLSVVRKEESDSFDLVYFLLAKGADPNIEDNIGRIPLHFAVRKDHIGVVRLLVNHGSRLDKVDISGKTPFDHARSELESRKLFNRYINGYFHEMIVYITESTRDYEKKKICPILLCAWAFDNCSIIYRDIFPLDMVKCIVGAVLNHFRGE